MDAIIKACEIVGGNAKLAQILGVTPGLVSQWRSGFTGISLERAIQIEKATAGAVRCEDMRPDIDWGYLRATDCTAPAGLDREVA
jgi:DNA-binding transcriptional regulator YdaS (Cro superfamily)